METIIKEYKRMHGVGRRETFYVIIIVLPGGDIEIPIIAQNLKASGTLNL